MKALGGILQRERADDGASGDATSVNANDTYTSFDPQDCEHIEFTSVNDVYIQGIKAPSIYQPHLIWIFGAANVYLYHLDAAASAADQVNLGSVFGGSGFIAGTVMSCRYSRQRGQWIIAGYPI